MKLIIFLGFALTTLTATAQNTKQTRMAYTASKAGLSMREKPGINAAVIAKIPYGTKVTIEINHDEVPVEISTEGMDGIWVKTTYNGKTGYIVSSYLLPVPPPKTGTRTLKEYFQQLAAPAGAPVVIKNGTDVNIGNDYYVVKKQIFKNGFEYHESNFYEADNTTYFLPEFTFQQGFILLRLFPEFAKVFAANDVFPTKDKIMKRGDDDFIIEVKRVKSDVVNTIEGIHITFTDGVYYDFEMFQIGNQLVISFGGGI